MIHKRITIDGQDIILSSNENAEIRVWVNGQADVYLPLVHNGRLTIQLTEAGLTALEEEKVFGYEDEREVEFFEL